MWQEINSKLIAAFLVCTVTMGKRGKKVTLKLNYVKVYVTVDMRATFFVDHESLPSINISDPSVWQHVSFLLLQSICMEYIEAFGILISYSNAGGPMSNQDKVSRAFSHATTTLSPDELFPRPKVIDAAYYLIGFIKN